MKKIFVNLLFVFSVSLAACVPLNSSPSPEVATPEHTPVATASSTPIPVTTSSSPVIDAAHPCGGATAPTEWQHVVVLVFENKDYNEVIGAAPYITSLSEKCATVKHWNDADSKVDGSADGAYNSKPNYATLTNGLPPSMHGIVTDHYAETTKVESIYQQLDAAGKTFKDYYEAEAGGCGVRFNGDYHDPIRYYANLTALCDAHDVPLSSFMSDVNSGNLPAFSFILPTNDHNMHDNSVASGDTYAQQFLEPLLNSPAYVKGDMAIFFLWEEGNQIPNVLIAPSIIAGTKVFVPTGNPVSHYSALRTWEEMLGLPLLGDTSRAPSLLQTYNGQ